MSSKPNNQISDYERQFNLQQRFRQSPDSFQQPLQERTFSSDTQITQQSAHHEQSQAHRIRRRPGDTLSSLSHNGHPKQQERQLKHLERHHPYQFPLQELRTQYSLNTRQMSMTSENSSTGNTNPNSAPPMPLVLDATHQKQQSSPKKGLNLWKKKRYDDYNPPSEISTASSSHISAASTLVSRFLNKKIPPFEITDQNEHDEPKTSAAEFARQAPQAGYLFKRGSQIAEYKRRFFVLQPSTYLYYFLSESDSKPRGCIDVEKELLRFQMVEECPDGRCRFELQSEDQCIQLEARSVEVAHEWRDALTECTFMHVKGQVAALEQERNGLLTRLEEMERRIEHYRLVEQDRDGALADARMYKEKFRDLDSALATLTRLVLNRSKVDKSEEHDEACKQEVETPDKSHDDQSSKPVQVSTLMPLSRVKSVDTDCPTGTHIFCDEESVHFSPLKSVEPSAEMKKKIASQLLSKDQQILCNVNLPDTNFEALSNACQMLKENLSLVSQEASDLQQQVSETSLEKARLERRMAKAEKLLTKLWEENCTLRDSSVKLTQERKLLIKEVRRLSQTHRPKRAHALGTPEKRLLQELEDELESMSAKYCQARGRPQLKPLKNCVSLLNDQTSADGGSNLKSQISTLWHNRKVHYDSRSVASDAGSRARSRRSRSAVSDTRVRSRSAVSDSGSHYRSRSIALETTILHQIRNNTSLLMEDNEPDCGSEHLVNQVSHNDFSNHGQSAVQSLVKTGMETGAGPRSPIKPRTLMLDKYKNMETDTVSDVSSLCQSAMFEEQVLNSSTTTVVDFETHVDEDNRSCDSYSSNEGEEILFSSEEVAEDPLALLEDETRIMNHVHHNMTQTQDNDKRQQNANVIQQGKATCRLDCPLTEMSQSMEGRKKAWTPTEMDGRVYHLTFYSRKIGLQFQKVPAPVRRQGRLSDLISPEDGGNLVSGFCKTVAELKTVASLAKRSRDYDIEQLEPSVSCKLASPIDAVLVCGFNGFDDANNCEKPKIGARLVAFDGISVEVGQWTFEAVKKAIQARGRPITLSFRNDPLNQEQRDILSRAVAQVGSDDYPTPAVSQVCTLAPSNDDWFHKSCNHYEKQYDFASPTSNYYSFSESGASSVLSRAVAPLVGNILKGISKADHKTDTYQPYYLNHDSKRTAGTHSKALHEFQAGLL